MNIKIYVGSNPGLPNLSRSLSALLDRIHVSGVPTDRLEIITSSPTEYEYPALNRLWLDSQREDFYGLYLHCKGASKSDESEFQNGLAWMHYMADGVLDNYKLCHHHLDQGADLVGSMWYRHFKGNFFWFKSSYIRTLAGPCALNNGARFAAEYWCSQAYWQNPAVAQPRVKNLFYLPLRSDHEFSKLRSEGVRPNFETRLVCTDIKSLDGTQDFTIYDEFQGSSEDYRAYGRLLGASANYNAQCFAGPTVVALMPREQLIGKLIRDMGKGAEIGVQCGMFARCLLQSFAGHLVLVDAWKHFPSETRDGSNVSDISQLQNMATTIKTVQEFPGRYDIVRDLSASAAKRYPDGYFDFVYIDANHRYETILEDVQIWAPKVRKGGIVCGHDYVDGEFTEGSFGVKRAVNEYFGRPPDMITYETWPSFFYRV